MAANKVIRFGPVAMAAAAANIINPPVVSGGVGLAGTNSAAYIVLRHIRIVNKSASTVNATLYIGATGASAAGTEFAFNAAPILAGGSVDWYGILRLDVADFLTGLASAATSLTFEAEGEIGIA